MKRDDAFLLDILRFSERAIRAANGRRLEELQRDETLQSALVHPLIVIGEAVKGLQCWKQSRAGGLPTPIPPLE